MVALIAVLAAGCNSDPPEIKLCKKIEATGLASGCGPRTSKYGGATSAGFMLKGEREGALWIFKDAAAFNANANVTAAKDGVVFLNGTALIKVTVWADVPQSERDKIEAVVSAER
jgi:hypothetical protein